MDDVKFGGAGKCMGARCNKNYSDVRVLVLNGLEIRFVFCVVHAVVFDGKMVVED